MDGVSGKGIVFIPVKVLAPTLSNINRQNWMVYSVDKNKGGQRQERPNHSHVQRIRSNLKSCHKENGCKCD
ncbi:unnamed protein product [Urochloa humidicola]